MQPCFCPEHIRALCFCLSHTGTDDAVCVYRDTDCGFYYNWKKNTVVGCGGRCHQIRQRKNSNYINKNAGEEETDERLGGCSPRRHMMSAENMWCCLSLCLSEETTVPFNTVPSLGAVDCRDFHALLCKVLKYELLLGFKGNEVISTDRSHEKKQQLHLWNGAVLKSVHRWRARECGKMTNSWLLTITRYRRSRRHTRRLTRAKWKHDVTTTVCGNSFLTFLHRQAN